MAVGGGGDQRSKGHQFGKLRRTGLLELLDGCYCSEHTGIRKPDPRAFLAAIGGCDRGLSDVWVVGDDPVLDVDGGARAGLPTVWISHGRRWPDDRPRSTVTVTAPAEALRHLHGRYR